MPYRRIDLLADDLSIDSVRDALDDAEINDLYLIERDDGILQASVVLEESLTEHAIDVLEKAFGKQERFQLLVYEIAARLPEPEAEGDENKARQHHKARDRISRDELLDDLRPGSEVRAIYLAQVAISCVVAAVGMIRDSTALVIGGMVIAPLLLPSMSLGLATTIGDLRMMWRSVLTSMAGLGLGAGIAVVMGLAVPFDPGVQQIAMRAQTSYWDVVIAVAAGAAGALAVTTGVSAALIGVMVAVALVPPLVAVGLLLGSGEYAAAWGAMTLLMTNIVGVNLAAMGVFLIQGIRPGAFADDDRARRAVTHAAVLWGVLLLVMVLLIAFASPQNPLK